MPAVRFLLEFIMEKTMNHLGKIAAMALVVLSAGTAPVFADACSGRSHDTGTALGAVGGGLIGGLGTHSVAGGIGGAVVGGLAGNAIARSQDCHRRTARVHRQSYYVDRYGHRHYYYR
ncbi:MAG TPA: glycine zipper domain-containing protein [Rhizomicrobium sp.]|nr:glycine zipper domain-containing protein [Rhizomicrobium sp.]